MKVEPGVKRTIAFIDGQNLFHTAKEAFGYTYPNYNVTKLALAVCQKVGFHLEQVRFYTGVPDVGDDPFWNYFWNHKLAMMGRQQVHVFSRALRYRNQRVKLPDGTEHTFLAAEEKGIDVRIAIDVIRLAHQQSYDVALIFSQDQDLSEVADEVRAIATEQSRWIKVACAYPQSLVTKNPRGINRTDWVKIDRATYDACLDKRDYRPKTNPPGGPVK